MSDFIPRSDSELVIWLNNLSAKIAVQGPVIGLTPADVTSITNSCKQTADLINNVEQSKAALKTMVSQKDAAKDTSVNTIRSLSARIKSNAAYTDAIGQDLGIIGSPNNPDLPNMKPSLIAEAFPGYVRLKFTKKGFSGVNIYTRMKSANTWTFLARDTNSPYDDHRPLANAGTPETREYMAIGLDGDDEIGQQSDIVNVVFGG